MLTIVHSLPSLTCRLGEKNCIIIFYRNILSVWAPLRQVILNN